MHQAPLPRALRFLAPLVVLACVYLPAPARSDNQTLRIGAISVLSGEGASWGTNHQRASQLAAEETNAAGGINGRKIELIFEDSPHGLARNAVAAYSKLVHSQNVRLILGPLMMDELLAVAPLAKRDGVLLGGATYMPDAPDNFFTTWIDADFESDLLANYVRTKYERVAVMASQQSWEEHVAKRFRQTFAALGGEVAAFETPSFTATEVRMETLRIKQRKPQAVFVSSYLLLAKCLKEMRALGMAQPVFGIELDQSVIDSAGKAAEGLVFIAPSAPDDDFVKAFKARWGAAPDIPAASAYDAAKLLFAAIKQHGENLEKLIAHFQEFKNYQGASGSISRQAGKTLVSTSFYAVRDGKIIRQAGS